MKAQYVLLALAGLVAASPVAHVSTLESRQAGSSDTETELEDDACRDITFIFARGSTESGNMGTSSGPATCSQLKSRYGDASVACQGVGSPYDATLEDNFLPEGTSDAAIGEATRLFDLAHSKCPDSTVTAGGYSQGCAVMHGSIKSLPADVQNQIVGVVLYGDTRNEQDNEQIPNFPKDKVDIICAPDDFVCNGTLLVGPAHLTYVAYVPAAVNWLATKIG